MLGVRHFGYLFSAQTGLSITEIICIAQLFPMFVDEDDNRMLMGEFTDNELLKVLHSFQKDKITGPDGWPVEFFLGFLDLVGDYLLKVV